MARLHRESVSVSFHYLVRVSDAGSATQRRIPFELGEFAQLSAELRNKPVLDLKDAGTAIKLRFRDEIPLERVIDVDQRTIFGVFKASYSGHSYENTAKGNIPADSVSLRPFHFLLYLSLSGRIYVGAQYLGQFGGYQALRAALFKALPNPKGISAHTFRQDRMSISNVKAKEVQVELASRSSSISSPNVFTKKGMIIFKKQQEGDDFESQVAQGILSLRGRSPNDIKAEIAKLLGSGGLIDVEDDNIEDCVVVATVNGRKKNIYMIEDGSFATKFPIQVNLGPDGHPPYEDTKAAMIRLLGEEIIASSEDV